MTLYTDSIFLTNETEGFKQCRDTRWEISTTVLLCTAGFIDVFYRGEMLRIGKDDIFIRVPNATKLGPFEMSPDFRFMQISIPITLFQEYLKLHPVFHLSAKSIEFCEVYFHLLTLQLQDHQSEYRKQILMLIARGATMELLNYMDKTVSFDDIMRRSSVNSSDYTFRAFTQLLREFPHEREVQWYAKKLDITPKYLSEICKERSGKSASEWIADITVAELKHYLRETTLPIREVAKAMDFPNASFFCQYTKKHTGMTPNHFRKTKEA